MKLNSIRTSFIAAAIAIALAPSVASAGIFDDDEARKAILDLRNKVDAVSNKLDAKLETKADKSTALELANENEQLRAEIAKLRGQIEVLSNDLANTQRRQQDFYVDLDNRVRKLEPKRMTVDGKEATVDVNEQRAFDAAMTLFKGADYKNAANAFSSFLVNYPQSAYAGSAQYWLGNSYYTQRDFRNTIAAMQQLVKAYPDHPKAPEAMLNIASCHMELKEKAAAKKVLESLIAQYPETEAAQAAKNRLSAMK
ncbi:tol-pal system protein YbgF [Undibacterium sp. CY18W]|uniref:Cell division coordinator CpoB n=1 Tax=Undibacterium hunanense TaxID=2762292 RepID=A0ABR6ZV58_9BURK|nr:tol-pal system protein YbgF [Undibacterium hunanense]MBC3919752.1 tol-pal system protein YbgF [Undibacterium hunanense]